MKEVWKDIKGYEGFYQVSNLGRVKSLYRVVIRKNETRLTVNERILKEAENGKGYLGVNLCREGVSSFNKTHQLVAVGFLGHTPNGFELIVDHIDNNPLNNKSSNLQLITQRENVHKDMKQGTSKYVGVCYISKSGKWSTSICSNGKPKFLGLFNTETEASNKYNEALQVLTGQDKSEIERIVIKEEELV